MGSNKMSQRTQIKRSKTKRSIDKMDKAMNDVKKIGIISCCLIAVLLVIGIFINTEESYAAGFLQSLPTSFKSGRTDPLQSYINDDNNSIQIPTEFYGVDSAGKRLSFIYCMDHNKGMLGDITYTKGPSVKSNISVPGTNDSVTESYPGLIYILQNDTPIKKGDIITSAELNYDSINYYITQLAVWWYIDKANGLDDNKNYSTYGQVDSTLEDEDAGDKYDEHGNYKYFNNLSALDKKTITDLSKMDATDLEYDNARVLYAKKVLELVNGAIANEGNYTSTPESTNITIDTSTITYTMTNDYVETSVIYPKASNPNIETYSVSINNAIGNVQIVDENNNPIASTSIDANTGFKLRVPISELNGETFKANITISATYANLYDAYVYNPEDSEVELQRALLGIIEKPSASTSLDLEAPAIDVPNTNSTSYLIYGIGALIIIAGIVLIVVAKRPNNAKKK